MNRVRADDRRHAPTLTSTVIEPPHASDGRRRDAVEVEWLAAYLLAVIIDDDHNTMRHVRMTMQRVANSTQEITA